ncbi:hypothetical protein DJ68_16625 [Halorubrum sp. C3]|nr:hypothetical protein DJ68_16625 [Halorubrum sp. C3]
MDKIFRKMGIQSKTAISHDLCWALYDTGLLYTENSVEIEEDSESISYNLSELDVPDDQRDQLARLLQKYCDDDRIDSIRSLLADTEDFQERLRKTSPDAIQEDDPPADQFTDIVDEIYGDSDVPFDDPEVFEILDEWGTYIHDVDGNSVSKTELTEPQAKAIEQSMERARGTGFEWDNIRITDDFVQYTATGLSSEIGYYLLDDTFILKFRDYNCGVSLNSCSGVGVEVVVSWAVPSIDERVEMTRAYNESGKVIETAFEPHLSDLLAQGAKKEAFDEYRSVWTEVADRFIES